MMNSQLGSAVRWPDGGARRDAAPAVAHHSYGATYDTSREIRLDGKLVQFAFRNPHSFVHVQAPDESGARSGGPWNGAAPRSSPTTASPATR